MMGMFGTLPAAMGQFPVNGWQPSYGPDATSAPLVDPEKVRLAQLLAASSAAPAPGMIIPAGGPDVVPAPASPPTAAPVPNGMMGRTSSSMPAGRFDPPPSPDAPGVSMASPPVGDASVPMPNGVAPSGIFAALAGVPSYPSALPSDLQSSGFGAPLTTDSLGNSINGAGGMLGAQAKPKKPGYNDPGGWAERLAAIGDVLGHAGGLGSNGAMAALMQNREARRHEASAQAAALAEKRAEWAHGDSIERMKLDGQSGIERMKLDAPQYFTVGRDRIALDPVTGATHPLYHGESDAEDYAATLGLKAGTPEYKRAVQDYVLKSAGPTAFDSRTNLEGVRQGDRIQLRGMPTYSNLHPRPAGAGRVAGPPRTTGNVLAPILAKAAAGGTLSAGETQLYNRYMNGIHRGGAGGGGAAGGSGKVYTDGKGNRITWSGSAWVPAK